MFNCTKRRSRNYAKRIFEIRLKNVGVVLVKQMCDGRTDGRTNANKIFPKLYVLTPYLFIFINDSIPYSILNIRRMCLETRMPPLSAKWVYFPSRIWDLAKTGTWPVYYGYEQCLKIWKHLVNANLVILRKLKAGRTDGCKDGRKDKQTGKQTDGHVLHLMRRCLRPGIHIC
jgi:hypothetical protein